MIEKVIGKYLNKKNNKVVTDQDRIKIKVGYFKLPYIGVYSGTFKEKLNKLVRSVERIVVINWNLFRWYFKSF